MQKELLEENPGTSIRLLGINAPQAAAGNSQVQSTLPWLQDTVASDVYGQWNSRLRDVVILDRQNLEIARFNLSENDLSVESNYVQLKNLLKRAAGE